MKKFAVVVFFLLLKLMAFGQEEFITPSKFISRFPITLFTGGVVVLKAQLAAFPDTLNFILDSGSGGISLDSSTVDYFGLKPQPSDRTIRGIAGIRAVSFIKNEKLHFPNLTVDSLNFHVLDYSLLTSVYGEKIDGIIGYSILSRYIIKLNYDSLNIEFWTKGAMKYPRGGFLFKPLITSLPIQTVRVRDEKTINARFLYDIGAGLNMMLTTDFVKDSAFLGKKRRMYAKQAEGLGGKIDMHMTIIKELKLGPYRFRNVPVYIFDDTYNVTSYPYLGGLIGNDLLRRFNCILNYEKRDFYLIPNGQFNAPFDYSYSGIELYLIDSEIILGDVAKGSPAEKAGLLEGDVVIAINKDFSQNIHQFKNALQHTGTPAKLIIRRNGSLLEFEFKIRNLLR
jgi:hypothetical protein